MDALSEESVVPIMNYEDEYVDNEKEENLVEMEKERSEESAVFHMIMIMIMRTLMRIQMKTKMTLETI